MCHPEPTHTVLEVLLRLVGARRPVGQVKTSFDFGRSKVVTRCARMHCALFALEPIAAALNQPFTRAGVAHHARPTKKIAGRMLQTLAGDHFLAPRKPVFDSSPWRRRAEGTASRKCRRSPGPDSAIELPTRAKLARGRREKKTKRPALRRSFDSAGGFPSFDSGSICTTT